jgi:seryl-tRNA synthetase
MSGRVTPGFFFTFASLKFRPMLQLTYIREHEKEVIGRLAVKRFDGAGIIRQIIELDDRRRETQKQLDDIQAGSNTIAREIGILFQSGKTEEANRKKEETGELKIQAKELNARAAGQGS